MNGKAMRCLGRSLISSISNGRGKRLTVSRASSSLSQILQQIENGSLSAKDAEKMIQTQSTSTSHSVQGGKAPNDVLSSFANLDHSRSKRAGFPEVSLICFQESIYAYSMALIYVMLNLLVSLVGNFCSRKNSLASCCHLG